MVEMLGGAGVGWGLSQLFNPSGLGGYAHTFHCKEPRFMAMMGLSRRAASGHSPWFPHWAAAGQEVMFGATRYGGNGREAKGEHRGTPIP